MTPATSLAALSLAALCATGVIADGGTSTTSPVEGSCSGPFCSLEIDGIGPGRPGAGSPTDPVGGMPSEEQVERAVLYYDAAGLPWCRFDGVMLRDDEIDAGYAMRPCPLDDPVPADAVDVVSALAREFLTLPIAPSPIYHQPVTDWALVNVDFIVYTDTSAQVFDRRLFAMDVRFRASPVHYSWDFGDGSPLLETSSPGRPYPYQNLAHVYTSAAEAVTVSVTTTWQGEFQLNGAGPWYPVATYATTVAEADPVEIVAMDVRLVPGPDR